MAFLDLLGSIFRPMADVVDHLTVSGDDKAKLQMAVTQGQITAAGALMDYEKQLLTAQTDIITAEAKGESWLQTSWRPITMLTFLALVVVDAVGLLPFRLADQAWTLLQLGLGGYVAGRSLEKVASAVPNIVSAVKK